MILTVTYEIDENAPSPLAWDDYRNNIEQEWKSLLNASTDESDYQSFLERHPCMLPGSFGVLGPSNHGPFPACVIAQPVLPDFNRKIPDFLWISFNSTFVYLTLIEIESPAKKWFKQNNDPTADFTQAKNQLAQWRAWFGNQVNQLAFYRHYRLPDYFQRERTLVPQYILIYGREKEANRSRELSLLRGNLSGTDEHIMTFDRLAPDANAAEFMTSKITANGYKAVFVPPTLTLGPNLADRRSFITDKEEAVRRSSGMTDERKAFLVKRFPYWDKWADAGRLAGVSTTQGLPRE